MWWPTSTELTWGGVLPARQSNQGLRAPPPDVEPAAIVRRDDPIGAGGLTAGDLLPAISWLPLPQATCRKVEVRDDESTARKRGNRVHANALGRDHTSYPHEPQRRRTGIDFEDFDGFSLAVAHHVKRVRCIVARPQAQTVRSEAAGHGSRA